VFGRTLLAECLPVELRLYHAWMEDLAAFVLAGGLSTRMGTDKAFLELSGRSLLENALGLVRSVCADVHIVGSPAKFSSFGPVVSDIFGNRGPLGGIHAALSASTAELNLIIAVDLPFLDRRFLRYLVKTSAESTALVTVPRLNGRYEPLCGVYRKPFGEFADAALEMGRNKIDALFSQTSVRPIEDDEFAANNFVPLMFRNVNTPEEWERAKSEFAHLGGHL
jgi:molybdenum cofactor guanylyltransferase